MPVPAALRRGQRLDYYKPHGSSLTVGELARIRGHRPIGRMGPWVVWGVHGFEVRGHVDIDFTQGGNGARYRYVPEEDIWVDRILTPPDKAATIVHEIAETRLMFKGVSYSRAHEFASSCEVDMRSAFARGALARPRTDQAALECARRWLDDRRRGGA